MSDKNGKKTNVLTQRVGILKDSYCLHLARSGQVNRSFEAVGVSRSSVDRWRKEDPIFVISEQQALKDYAALLEAEADRRAVEGVDDPVYQGGQLVGQRRRYSDNLLMFRLKGMNPEKYRDYQSGLAVGAAKVEIHVHTDADAPPAIVADEQPLGDVLEPGGEDQG